MYSNISINNTERKEIGVPILKRTDEMIAQFDLDYERYYKIGKLNLKRDKQFQEFLKLQEQHLFYLKNLIKILKIYFKENNYNSESYFLEFQNPIKVKNKKRRKKRTKSLRIMRNKYIYYNIIKRNKFYSLYKPYLNPLSEIGKKKLFFIKSKTESNIYKKNRTIKLENTELKLYFNKFGVYPVNFIKKEGEGAKTKKNRAKSSHNFIRSYYYGTRSFDNKTQLLFKKGIIKEKYYGGFEKMKKFIYMKNLKKKNIINLKAKSTNRNNNNTIKNRFSTTKQNMSSNNIYSNQTANFKNFSAIILKGKNEKNNSYMNLNNHQLINKKIEQNKNSKYINLSNVNPSSYHIKSAKTTKNKFSKYSYSKINPMDIKNKSINFNNKNNNFRKNKIIDYISQFKNEYSTTMKKSQMLSQDISFSNKIFTLTRTNYNKAKKVLNESTLKKIDMVNIIKQDVFEKKRKLLAKFKYIKENSSGNIRLNIVDFIRTPQYKLSYINDYYKQREQFKKYKQIDSLEQSTEEKNEFNVLYDRNKNEKNKKILQQKDKIIINWRTVKNKH